MYIFNLQVLIAEFNSLQNQFDKLLVDCAKLFETLFNQRRFQTDIETLKDKLTQCRVTKDEKNKSLKVF